MLLYIIISSVNSDSFPASPPQSLLIFFWTLAKSKTLSIVMNRRDRIKHLCFRPDLRGQYFTLLPRSMMLAVGFFVDTLHQIGNIPLYL